MGVFSRQDRHFLSSVAKLGYGNPFLTERIPFEKAALGREFVPGGEVWSASVTDPDAEPPNVTAIYKKLSAMMELLPARLAAAPDLGDEELAAYEESVHYLLYQRYHPRFVAAQGKWRFYREFLADWNRLCRIRANVSKAGWSPRTSSLVSARSSVRFMQSTTTSSATRCRRRGCAPASGSPSFRTTCAGIGACLYARMGDFPTLITGPSGTGKELIARAIAGARYVPFNAERMEFADASGESFLRD